MERTDFCCLSRLLVLVLLTGCVHCQSDAQDAQSQIPFRVTRAERRENGNVDKVKLYFEGSITPDIYIGKHNFKVIHANEPGMVEFDIPTNKLSVAYFALPDRYVMVGLSPRENSDSMDIPSVSFNILQGQDIQYKTGEDVQLDFTFDIEGETGHAIPEEMEYEIIVGSRTQENVANRYNSDYIKWHSEEAPVKLDVVSSGGTPTHQYGTLVLNSKLGDVEGVIDITVSIKFNCTINCFVYHLKDTLSLNVYQEGHDGPFPADFLGFIHDDKREGSSHFSCALGSGDCHITCEAVGVEGMAGVEITKRTVSDKGLQSVSLVRGIWGISILHVPGVSFQDAGDLSCRAWTQTKEVTEVLTLGVAQRVLIDRQVSVVTTFSNGSLLFTCLAEGIPTPDVTLHDFSSGRPRLVNQTHVTHPSQSQTRVDHLVDGPRPTSHMGSYEMYCHAANADSGQARVAFADIVYYYYVKE